MNKKIGLLGGTFDPIHNGHLYMAEVACEQLGLDEVIFIPTGKVPHKDNNLITDSNHRYNMVCIAVKNFEKYSVSDIEINRKVVSYTFETVKEFSEKYDNDKLYFIVGADSIFAIDTWKNPSEILKYVSLVVINRNTDTDENIYDFCKKTEVKYNGEIIVLDAFGPDISSTKIRTGNIDDNVTPEEVLEYIRKNKLYTEM